MSDKKYKFDALTVNGGLNPETGAEAHYHQFSERALLESLRRPFRPIW